MRIPSLIFGTVLACGLALAAGNEAVVYTAGNLTGIVPRTNAVLDLSQDTALKLRIGRTDVSVLFASITKTNEAPDSTFVPAPGKKGAKPFELLTVEFNSFQGEPRTMTLEMSQLAASHVLATIHKHVPAETKVAAVQTTAQATTSSNTTSSNTAASTTTASASDTGSTAAQSTPEKAVKPAKAPKAAKQDQAKADRAKPDQQAKADKAKADQQAKADKAKADQQAKADKAKAEQQAKADKKADKVAKKSKKDKKNEDKEVAANGAPAKPAAKKDDWWGDSIWKTNRNLPKWEQQGSTAAAQ
jgi:hypothetical protein